MTTSTTNRKPVVADVDPAKNREQRRAAAKVAAAGKPIVEKKTNPVLARAAKSAAAEAAKVTPIDTAGITVEEIEAMSQVERLSACKPERSALAAWKAAGRQGDRPLTPIMSWMENPTVVKARAKKATSKRAEVSRTAEQAELLSSTIVAERAAGTSWFSIAKKLTELGIPATANGTTWFNTTAFGTAKRLGLIEDGEGLSRRAGTVKAKTTKAAKKVAAKPVVELPVKATSSRAKKAAAKPAGSLVGKGVKTSMPIVTVGQRPAVVKAAKK